MKRYYILALIFFTTQSIQCKLNSFGISDLTIQETSSLDQKNELIQQRITEELGTHFTIQDILAFITRVQDYYQDLLNTPSDDENTKNWQILELAYKDIRKAKMSPSIKANQTTPEEQHELRVALGKLQREIQPLQ